MESPRLVLWESLTKRDFDTIDRSRAVVLVTCSPIEVHGPHLPMGADALESEGLIERMLRSYRKALAFFGERSYSGAPAGASAEIGERILDTLGEHAGVACTEILDGTIGPEDCHSPLWKLRFLLLDPLMIRLSHRLLGFRNGIA